MAIRSLTIFALTMFLVLVRPYKMNVGLAAAIGAGLTLVSGAVGPSEVAVVWRMTWNATLALVFIIVVSLVLDEAGFFRWAALHAARLGGGSARRLFVLLILMGAGMSTLFTNDGAILILTPIVAELVEAVGFDHAAGLACVMAVGFVIDAVSTPLITSNLVNIINADYAGLGFLAYARVMAWPSLVALIASLGVLFLFFRRDLPGGYDPDALPTPGTAIRDRPTFLAGLGVLTAMVAGFFAARGLALPVSAVIGAAALALLAVAMAPRARGKRPLLDRRSAGALLKAAPWPVVIFSVAMYLVVFGLRDAGLIDGAARLVAGAARHGRAAGVMAVGVGSAALSGAVNNLPATMIGALTVAGASGAGAATGAGHALMVYANVIGSDIGPKLTPIGSLATLLWLDSLKRRGLTVSWQYYLKVGLVITPPVLVAALMALARMG